MSPPPGAVRPAPTPTQQRIVDLPAGPVVLLGGAGTGKTFALARRAARLADLDRPADRDQRPGLEPILALAPTAVACDDLRTRIEEALARPFEQLNVLTPHAFAAQLLAAESGEAGLDPLVATAGAADRLALLLDRVDELTIRSHDFRGRPAAMLSGVLSRIDRCKEEMVTAQAYAAWADALPRATDGAAARADHEREFAALYASHDQMLAEEGLLDTGELILRAHRLLAERADVRARTAKRFPNIVADDWQDASYAITRLVLLLAGEHGSLTVAGDDDQTLARFRGAGAKNLADVSVAFPATETVRLQTSLRCGDQVLEAAEAVVHPIQERLAAAGGQVAQPNPGHPGSVWFWRCANERAQAQAAAAEIERLVREGTAPHDIAVLVRSVRREGQAIAMALEERAVAYRLVGATAFFQHAEIRDVLAWLRLLTDPGDAAAVVRALSRPPIALNAVDLARCVQIARRRKLDMVSALSAAIESPQIPPEARDRILAFLRLQRSARGALDTTRPDLFVHRLIGHLGLRRQQLFSAQADVVERLVHLARFGELASGFTNRMPQATPREFARYIAAVADIDPAHPRDDEHEPWVGEQPLRDAVTVTTMHAAKGGEWDHVLVLGLQSPRMPGARRQIAEPIPDELLVERLAPDTRERHIDDMRRLLHVAMTRARRSLVLAYAAEQDAGSAGTGSPSRQSPSAFVEEARSAVGGEWEERGEELFGPTETLHATFSTLRDELISSIPGTASRLGELRLDTDVDVTHGAARYLELLKLAALMHRTEGQPVEELLAQVNATILQSATAEQKEVLISSPLDEIILGADRDARARTQAIAQRQEPSLEAFLPRRGEGLMLSASDIDTYRACPLKYKFARVFRIPQEPTLNQRFGIAFHQVLDRFHTAGGTTGAELTELFDTAWRRGGFGDSEEERQLRAKAEGALVRYLDRFHEEEGEPVWFERSFSFKLGPHVLRGRVDRVDRLPDGVFELIDYKTGRPRTAAQLREDVQLSLYAVGAREAWDLEASRQSYHYVLDDEKVPVPTEAMDRDWISETVFTVADGILSQGFEPTPSYAVCAMCDYRIACPAAER